MLERLAQRLTLAAGIILMSNPLTGCVAYIPGAAIDGIHDTLTGEKGKYCVAPHVQPGEQIRLANGTTGKVMSLSGKSTRCPDPQRPIRADVAG